MKILVVLTYYRPHVSGLTIYVERLSRALAARGHQVTVLTSQYDKSLLLREQLHGVDVIRLPVLMRVSKGVIAPQMGPMAWKLVAQHDVLSLHLPQESAAGLAVRGRLFRKPTVLTYHSDLLLPPSPVNYVATTALTVVNHIAARLAHRIVAYTDDFARNSPFLSQYLSKIEVVPPPVEMPTPTPEAVQTFRDQHSLNGAGPVIGLAVRMAAEKGVEYLLEALPAIFEKHPNTTIVHAGPREAIGEAEYRRKLEPWLQRFRSHYVYVGTLNPEQMAVFFRTCDVHVLPSINSTETFGLVQIEAALCGTPSVASALPGVRMPTQMTGMGLTVPPRDPRALADAICKILAHREQYVRPPQPIAAMFSPAATAERYEGLFESLLKH